MSELDPEKLDKLKVAELQEELKARGLDTKGKKAFLVKRLRIALLNESDGGPDDTGDLNSSQENLDDSSQEADLQAEASQPEKGEANDSDVEEQTKEQEPAEAFEEEPKAEEAPYEEPEQVQGDEEEIAEEEQFQADEQIPAEEQDQREEAEAQKYDDETADDNQAMDFENDVEDTGDVKEEQAEQQEDNVAVKEEKMDDQEKEGQEVKTEVNGDDLELEGKVKEEKTEEEKDEENKDDADKKEEKSEDKKKGRGEKRKHSRSRSRDREDRRSRDRDRDRDRKREPLVKKRAKSPIEPEDDSWKKLTNVTLDKYNSELSLKISKDGLSAKPATDGGFAMVWSGVRGSFGVTKGKVAYEVKLVENMSVDHLGKEETNPHVLRLGWSTDDNSLLLGEEELSYGYGGTAKASTNLKFHDFGEKFTAGDVMTAYLDFDSDPVQISFSKNGEFLGNCFEVEKEKFQDKAVFPHILTKNTSFQCNFGAKEEPFFPLQEGYQFIDAVPLEERVRGAEQPEKSEDCEIVMMVGLPASGKTTWVEKCSQEHPNAKFNVLGTNCLIDKMKVMGLPRKRNYAGRWDVLIDMSTKCLNRLLEIASKRKRNYILDQVW